MAWACEVCGAPDNDDGEPCRACGAIPVPAKITFTTDAGESVTFAIGFQLNRSWAQSVFGDDARYWDVDNQMRVERRDDGWYVVPNASAGNETLVDGVCITAPTRLEPGSVVAVGRESKGIQKTRMIVSF